MTEEEVESVLAGHEDSSGCINYEGAGPGGRNGCGGGKRRPEACGRRHPGA